MLLFTLVALSMEPAPAGKAKTAHVIVLGNEKGGAGKSTMAINVIVALLKAGHSVASVDTDSRQRSLTRMIENRAAWARRSGLWLEVPTHYVVKLGRGEVVREIEAHEFDGLADVVDQVEREFDFVVIDTPASNSYLMRISHSMADTLITPINDSFMDLDVLGHLDPGDYSVIGISHYAELVREARQQRRLVDGVATDWIVVRNRLATLTSRNQRHVLDALGELVDASRLPAGRRRLGARHLSRAVRDGAHRPRWARSPDARRRTDDVARGRAPGNPRPGRLPPPSGGAAERTPRRRCRAALGRAHARRDAGRLKQLLPGFSVPH